VRDEALPSPYRRSREWHGGEKPEAALQVKRVVHAAGVHACGAGEVRVGKNCIVNMKTRGEIARCWQNSRR